MKIIITAANGFIGKSLLEYFNKKHEVVALVREIPENKQGINYQLWDGVHLGEWTFELEGAFAVINLAGRSVNCRYDETNKSEIYSSRLNSTEIIGKAIEQCADKPKVWINAASATIYKHSLLEPMTEKTGEIGEGFSVDVCKRWEKKFGDYKQENVRQIVLRTAIVLGKNGGVMKPFNRLVKFGLGGKMAQGNQMFSWIHEKDFCKAVEFLMENEKCEGIYNLSAPNPVTNQKFMKTLREEKNFPLGIPSPAWLLKTGAKLIGTETELIFKSRFVVPERLMKEGFVFDFPEISECLADLATEEDELESVENKWIITSILGSFITALIISGYVSIKDTSIVLYVFFATFIGCFTVSLLCSIPVAIFALYIRNKAEFTNKRIKVRNFQIFLYAIALIIGRLIIDWNQQSDRKPFLAFAIMLTVYLFTGFMIWKQKITNKNYK